MDTLPPEKGSFPAKYAALSGFKSREARINEQVKKQKVEVIPDDPDPLASALNYLGKQNSAVGEIRRSLTEATLATADLVNLEVKSGFEVIGKTEEASGPFGDTWRLCGDFDIELMTDLDINGARRRGGESFRGFRVKGTDIYQDGHEIKRVNSKYVNEAFRSAIKIAEEKFLNGKYINRKWELADRKLDKDSAMVRLISPEGFVDLPLSEVKMMLDDIHIDLGRSKISNLEKFLIEGKSDRVGFVSIEGKHEGLKTHKMNEWDAENEKLSEPVFMVLSLTNEGEKPPLVHDPGIFAHINVVRTKDEQKTLKAINMEFSHATNGVPGLNDYYVPVIKRLFSGDNERVLKRIKKEIKGWIDPSQFWRTMQVEAQPFNNGLNIENDSFGGDNLMLELAKKIGVIQFDIKSQISPEMGKWIRSHTEMFGGAIGVATLAGLDMSGQSVMFPLDNPEKGLQIGLGLGGTELMLNLRSILGKLKNKILSPHDLNDINGFLNYWKNEGWKDEFVAEINRGKKGNSLITTFSSIVGTKGRDFIQNQLSARVVPEWANFTMGRLMISSLMGVPKDIAPFMEKISFFTARGKDNSAVVGEIGDEITGQFFARDPVIFAEAVAQKIKHDVKYQGVSVTALNMADALSEILEKNEHKKYDISNEAILKNSLWIMQLLKSEASVENTNFGKINRGNSKMIDVNLKTYLGSMGEDTNMRKEVMDSSRALVLIYLRSMEIHSRDDLKFDGIPNLKDEVVFLIKEKMANYVSAKIKLSILDEFRQRGVGGEFLYASEQVVNAMKWCQELDPLINTPELPDYIDQLLARAM